MLFPSHLVAALFGLGHEGLLTAAKDKFKSILHFRVCSLHIVNHFRRQALIARARNKMNNVNVLLVEHKTNRCVPVQPESVISHVFFVHPGAYDCVFKIRRCGAVCLLVVIYVRHKLPDELYIRQYMKLFSSYVHVIPPE